MNRLPVPAEPRREEAVRMACRALLACGVRRLPPDPEQVAREMDFQLHPLSFYGEILRRENVDLIRRTGGGEAFTLSRGQQFWIVYNETVSSPERIRFSVFHEFGHILLRHFDMGEEAALTEGQHRTLEEEANIFARNFFCPPPVADLIRGDLRDPRWARLFCVSDSAWQARIGTLEADRRYIDGHTADRIRIQFREYMFGRRCRECGLVFTDEARQGRCPGCGSRFLQWNPAMETRQQAGARRHVAGARAEDLRPRVGEEKNPDLTRYWELIRAEEKREKTIKERWT